jgi:hypothetical protein
MADCILLAVTAPEMDSATSGRPWHRLGARVRALFLADGRITDLPAARGLQADHDHLPGAALMALARLAEITRQPANLDALAANDDAGLPYAGRGIASYRFWAAASGGDSMSPQVSLFAMADWAGTHARSLRSLVTAWRQAGVEAAEEPADVAARYAGALSVEAALLEEALGNTLFAVPGFADHKARVLAYYREVVKYLPGERKPLDDAFFFAP